MVRVSRPHGLVFRVSRPQGRVWLVLSAWYYGVIGASEEKISRCLDTLLA